MRDNRFNSVNAITDLNLLEPVTRANTLNIIKDASEHGYTLKVAETYRSKQRQLHLYNQHFTQLKNVGVHHYGLAVDLNLIKNGIYDPKGEDYKFLVELCMKYGMISGIDWGTPKLPHSFRDWDHIQRITVKRQDSLFSGNWYPDESYNPITDK
jgi:hypothetical protein